MTPARGAHMGLVMAVAWAMQVKANPSPWTNRPFSEATQRRPVPSRAMVPVSGSLPTKTGLILPSRIRTRPLRVSTHRPPPGAARMEAT